MESSGGDLKDEEPQQSAIDSPELNKSVVQSNERLVFEGNKTSIEGDGDSHRD